MLDNNIIIIWLDANCHDRSVNSLKILNELQQIINSIETFTDANLCQEFLQNTIDKNQIVYLVISDRFLEFPIHHIHNLISIDSIYVYGQNINQFESWANKYFKLKGHLFREISELCYQLTQDIRHYENNLIPIHIFENRLTENQLNQLEPNFMYSQLLKEILININYDEKVKKEFIQYCILHSNIFNIKQMNIIDEFENDYEKHSPIWWYTRECFVYQMLNNALRTGNIETLIKMGFFIRDLHRQIHHLYCSQEHSTMIVYRGQGMTNNQFEKLSKCKGGLISFLYFLSTSRNKQISLEFARQAIEKPDLRGIIFRMKIDRKMISLSNPYASINKLSYFKNSEKEILFSTHTVFRIEDIRPLKNENKIWQVYLKLTTNQDDVQLEQLTKHLRQDVQYLSNPWESLAKLMLTMREFDRAQEIYENILEKTASNDKEQLAFIYHQLGCVHNEKQNLNRSLEYFKLSLDIKANYLPGNYNDPQLADTYSNIGSIYHAQVNLDNALLYFQYALNTNSNDQRVLASIYNNIGMVLKRQGYFHNALNHFQKSLQIDLNSLPPIHPDLATTYSNIGRVYFLLKDYANALSYYKKTLDIRRLSLPQNHPSLLIAISNYQNTAILLPRTSSLSELSTPILSKKKRPCLKSFKSCSKLNDKTSICVKTIARK